MKRGDQEMKPFYSTISGCRLRWFLRQKITLRKYAQLPTNSASTKARNKELNNGLSGELPSLT